MSDRPRIIIPEGFPPVWAGGWGEDPHGIYAELVLRNASFLLRWIPPGEFLMGSPESELGRDDNETQHRVTITRGLWLAATPCTQKQWKEVMGDNPSHFQGPDRPVENVNWRETILFCLRLNESIRDAGYSTEGFEFRLPTEAEWENACRAGTTSAFNDGSPCTLPNGKDPALDPLGWHGEGDNAQTHPVGAKAPNGWGLHDLHGNVWEWCADHAEWKDILVTDTYVDGIVDPLCGNGAWRVARGGSCWGGSGNCRSAFRGASAPGLRFWARGFRLAAGQELGRGAPSLPASGVSPQGKAK